MNTAKPSKPRVINVNKCPSSARGRNSMSNRVGQVASIINTDSASIKFPKAHELSISLFVRIRRYASNDNTVMKVIKKNPGINFREIMRSTNLKNGILSYYLNKIRKNGSVQIKADHNKKRFYDLDISENEFKVISALRAQTTRDLLLALIEMKD